MKAFARRLLTGSSLLGLVLVAMPAAAQVLSPTTAQRPAVPVEQALRELESIYGTRFVYEAGLLTGKTTTVRVEPGHPVEDLLRAILYPSSLLFVYVEKNYYALAPAGGADRSPAEPPATGGARIIRGLVQDEQGQALPGATVLAGSSSQVGSSTSASGRFELAVAASVANLRVSSLGFEDQTVSLAGSQNQYTVTLRAQTVGLQSVVVVSNGYESLPRERASGSFGIVTSKQLAEIPLPNLVQRLEGQVAGVQLGLEDSDNSFLYRNSVVTPAGGAIGQGSYSLKVRGVTTLNNNVNDRPLLVLDGLPSEFDIRTLNPQDVEQVTILKDAAAASIWGARAANGVLVVQTKQGRYNRPLSLTFGTSLSLAGRPRLNALPLLDAGQLLNYEQELVAKGLLTDPGLPPAAGGAYLPRPVTAAQEVLFQAQRGSITSAQRDAGLAELAARGRVGYDHMQQYLLQPAATQAYNVSLRGGGENSTYFLSASYARERTNAVNANGSRLTLTANQEYKLWRVVTLTARAKGIFFKQRQDGLGLATLASSPTMILPYNPLVDTRGQGIAYDFAFYAPKLRQLDSLGYQPYRYNFLAERDQQSDKMTENNYWGGLNASVPLWPGLSAHGLLAFERTYGEQQVYYAPGSYYARNAVNQATFYNASTGKLLYGLPVGAIYTPYQYGRDNYTLRGQLTLDREFGGTHQLTALAGSEIRRTLQTVNSQTFYGYDDQSQRYGLVDYRTPYLTLDGSSELLPDRTIIANRENRFLSYFANASYTLRSRYTASASVRYDDYNNLGLARRYRATPFFSAGLAWTLTQESWLQNRPWLSNLRVRLTYGHNGNVPAGAYPYTGISLDTDDRATGQNYAVLTAPANPALRWERTAMTNVGVDVGFFGGRLTGSAEVYDKRSYDLFVTYPANPTYGFGFLTRNAAQLNGRGIDLALGGSPVQSAAWEWSLNGVLSYNTNHVVRFAGDNSRLVGNSAGPAVLPGYAVDNLFVFRSAGLDNAGRQLVYDQQGQVLNAYVPTNFSDLQSAGRLNPAWTAGLTQTLRYKDLSLYVQLVGKFNYVFILPTFRSLSVDKSVAGYDLHTDLDRRWRQPGDEATTSVVGVAGASGNSYQRYYYSDRRVQRGDHLRLREVALRYRVPPSLLGRVSLVKDVSLSAAARNLGLVWRRNKLGIDPDFLPILSLVKLPPAVSFVLSLDASF